jgi:FecR protein
MLTLKTVLVCTPALVAGFVFLPSAKAASPPPGAINFVEGHVTLDGQAAVAGETSIVGAGQTLATQKGKAEILLTPGVFVRVAENSAVKMDAASAKAVRVELLRGEALVEVVQVDNSYAIDVIDKGADARLEKGGLYLFNANQGAVSVYHGKARVDDDRRVFTLTKGEQLALTGNGALKPQKFDRTKTNAVYEWSKKRADFHAEASQWQAEALIGLDGASSYATGWYWNHWFKTWAFVPSHGFHLSPFGYGYYSPNSPQYMTPVFGDFR